MGDVDWGGLIFGMLCVVLNGITLGHSTWREEGLKQKAATEACTNGTCIAPHCLLLL
jgi:hypothetical protein